MQDDLNTPAPLPMRLELIARLKQALPQFVLGPEEPNLAVGLAANLLVNDRTPDILGRAARELAWWTWQKAPLDMKAARLLASTGDEPGAPGKRTRALASALAALPEVDEEIGHLVREAVQGGEHKAVIKLVLPLLAKPGIGPAVLGRVLPILAPAGEAELHRAAISACAGLRSLPPLLEALEAQWAVLHLPPDQAEAKVEAMDRECFPWWRGYLAAELALRQGDAQRGTALLAELWQALPWQVNICLKLHRLLFPLPPDPRAVEEEDTAVLLYSYNKGELLAATLESLLATNLGRAGVWVLNNASTDNTGDMLAAMADKHPDRLNIVTLPVNVGAPAARNWLLSLPEVKTRTWAAFVDDDVVLPPDWLNHLLAHARAAKGIGTVGLRIAGADDPAFLQSADYNLLPARPGNRDEDGMERNVLVFDNCAGSPDLGLFDYTRPCASVSGCCHLLGMDSVREVGDFDIRYTPTQFDDLDRDLRCLLAGRPALYAGGERIRHVQFSSLAKASTPAQAANVMGNQIKLNAKFDAETMAKATETNLEILWADWKAKTKKMSPPPSPHIARTF